MTSVIQQQNGAQRRGKLEKPLADTDAKAQLQWNDKNQSQARVLRYKRTAALITGLCEKLRRALGRK